MTRKNADDPRKLRDVLARTQSLATMHDVPSVVVGFAASEGNLLFPELIAFLESELRVEDQIFRLTRERALLFLSDVGHEQAVSVVERLRATFQEWRLRARSRSELARLDEHQLRDIGLSVSQASFESGKSFLER